MVPFSPWICYEIMSVLSPTGSMTQDLYKYLTFHARDMMCDLTTSRSFLMETIQDICFGLECKSNAMANNSLSKRRTNNRIDKGAPKCMGFMFELLLSILNQVCLLEPSTFQLWYSLSYEINSLTLKKTYKNFVHSNYTCTIIPHDKYEDKRFTASQRTKTLQE